MHEYNTCIIINQSFSHAMRAIKPSHTDIHVLNKYAHEFDRIGLIGSDEM